MAPPSTPNPMVPNPMYEELSSLYASLQRDAPTMSDALKPADQQMAAGQTWVGPAAQSWESDLGGRSRDCASQVTAMLATVEQALRSEPPQVDAKVAQQKLQTLGLLARAYNYNY